MNILIVSQYFYPEQFRINEIACELVSRGNSVDVVTGLPNYPEGEVYEGYNNLLEECYFGVKIYRTKIRPRHKGALNRFRNYLSFMLNAKKTIKKLKGHYDIVFCYMLSPIFQLTPAIFAKKRFKCPLVLMCLDQWPESLKAGGISKGIVYQIISKYCITVLNKCDFIINTAHSFIKYNHEVNKVPLNKMSWCIQHSIDSFKDINTSKNVKTNTVDLMFAGNIGKVQNVKDIILAYNQLKYKNLKIHIFGDGSSLNSCKELVEKLDLKENVIFYGRVNNAELEKRYCEMDACLLTLSGKTEIGNTIPAKFISYLSAGKTIIAAINGDSQEIMQQARCGIYTDADDYKKLSEIIDVFYKNIDSFKECGKNGRTYYEKYCTLSYFTDNLISFFNKVIG